MFWEVKEKDKYYNSVFLYDAFLTIYDILQTEVFCGAQNVANSFLPPAYFSSYSRPHDAYTAPRFRQGGTCSMNLRA